MTLSSTGRACAKCQVELHPVKSGVYVLEMADYGPYKLWAADKWGCRKCGLEIISGFGHHPLKEHFDEGFSDYVAKLRAAEETVIEVW